jgi:hypothetical protein
MSTATAPYSSITFHLAQHLYSSRFDAAASGEEFDKAVEKIKGSDN